MSKSLPTSLNTLLGRERETTTLRRLLRQPEVRLVTITGPGGVGKTSLALQVAHELQDAVTDGVFFISLATTTDSTLIIPTIAHTLGIAESPNRLLLDSIKDFLRDRQTLLLLDNFEQIISIAPLLTELLEACATLRILVTSREALRLRGEQEFPLAPLALPSQPSFKDLGQYPGIALFIERAQAILPHFQLTPDNANAVAEICAHLDGLPLAIDEASRGCRMCLCRRQAVSITAPSHHYTEVRPHLPLQSLQSVWFWVSPKKNLQQGYSLPKNNPCWPFNQVLPVRV